MAVLEIPVSNDTSFYKFQIALEDAVYILEFRFNTRMDRWLMNILNESEEPILMGIPMLTGIPLINGFVVDGKPPGTFFCYDESGQSRNPDRETFGRDVKLVYIESE
jgi:hypothetical protein